MSAVQELDRLRAVLPRGGALTDEAWEARHRGIRTLAWLHVPVLAVIMVLHSRVLPSTLALLVVAALLAAGGYGATPQRVRSSAVTLSLLTSTALLIEIFNGLIEMHFHFFVVIAVVAIYQSWMPYLLAIGFVFAHHIVMGVFMPMDVYNHPGAIEHRREAAGRLYSVGEFAAEVARAVVDPVPPDHIRLVGDTSSFAPAP